MLRKSVHFLRHFLTAQSRYDVHSPFVYEFVTRVLPHRGSATGARIDALRRSCAHSREMLEIADYGAGYGGQARPHLQKTLAQVIRSSARGRREGELLHRICQRYQPAVALELGSNLGFSTLYQAMALPESRLISLEGAASLAEKARAHCASMGVNPDIRTTEFTPGLQALLSDPNFRLDYLLLDGNHRYAPTLEYFHQLLPRMNPGAILILDDINWSREMQKAWREIIAHAAVSVSIDLFFLGICFIHRPQRKQHFSFRFFP